MQPICYQAATLAKCCDEVKDCKSLKNDESNDARYDDARSFICGLYFLPIHESVKSACQTGQVEHKFFVISNVPDFQKIVQCLMY